MKQEEHKEDYERGETQKEEECGKEKEKRSEKNAKE